MAIKYRDVGTKNSNLRRVRRGDKIRARYLNSIRDSIRRLEGVRSANTESDYTADPEAASASQPEKFTVDSENLNTLQCTSVTGAYGLVVAKPPGMRGAIATRTVNAENQIILPAYTGTPGPNVVNTIMAVRIGEAQTELTGVEWEDINNAGRMWAEDT